MRSFKVHIILIAILSHGVQGLGQLKGSPSRVKQDMINTSLVTATTPITGSIVRDEHRALDITSGGGNGNGNGNGGSGDGQWKEKKKKNREKKEKEKELLLNGTTESTTEEKIVPIEVINITPNATPAPIKVVAPDDDYYNDDNKPDTLGVPGDAEEANDTANTPVTNSPVADVETPNTKAPTAAKIDDGKIDAKEFDDDKESTAAENFDDDKEFNDKESTAAEKMDDDGEVDDAKESTAAESFDDDGEFDDDKASATDAPTGKATSSPTRAATGSPSASPTKATVAPTAKATVKVTDAPTASPTAKKIVKKTSPPTTAMDDTLIGDDDDALDGSSGNLFKTQEPTPPPTIYKSPTPSPTPSPTKDKSKSSKSTKNSGTMDDIYKDLTPEEIEYLHHHEVLNEEKEAARISILYLVVTLVLMVFTAQQLSENPDGVYANICRLGITVTGCVFKILLLPFKKICGLGSRNGYSHHLVTTNTDFRDPYSARTNRMEIV